ncbi:hypothetical protein D3C81_2160580 [compost metagenome]
MGGHYPEAGKDQGRQARPQQRLAAEPLQCTGVGAEPQQADAQDRVEPDLGHHRKQRGHGRRRARVGLR